MRVVIPRSSPAGRERCYALLVRSIDDARPGYPFTGRFLRCGSAVDDSELRPADFPRVPLLIEFAGGDRSGSGHNRSPDIHVLWRYEASAGFREIARVRSQGGEWVYHLRPLVERELVLPRIDGVEVARKACARVLELLDRELAGVPVEARIRVVTLVHDGVAARLVA